MSTDSPLVVAVVLNWNSYDDSAECLRGLRNQSFETMDVVLVDNGSTDGSAEKLQQEFEEVDMICNDRNLGFTGGMNTGIQEALSRDPEFVLLANNDIRLSGSDVVTRLVEKYRATPSLGALSPSFSSSSASSSFIWSSPSNFRNGRNSQRQFVREISDSDLSYGCHYGFVLFSQEILECVGVFDEKYFLYFEDIEHGARIEDRGYHLATYDTLSVEHKSHGSSSSPIGPVPSYYQARNRLLFMKEYNSLSEYMYLIPLYVWWFITRLSYRLYQGNTAGAVAMFRGFTDVVHGKTGKGPYP